MLALLWSRLSGEARKNIKEQESKRKMTWQNAKMGNRSEQAGVVGGLG